MKILSIIENEKSAIRKMRNAVRYYNKTNAEISALGEKKRYEEEKEKLRFSGRITTTSVRYFEEVWTNRMYFEIEYGNMKFSGSFLFGTCDRGCCWGTVKESPRATLEIYGEKMSSEMADNFAKSHGKLILAKGEQNKYESLNTPEKLRAKYSNWINLFIILSIHGICSIGLYLDIWTTLSKGIIIFMMVMGALCALMANDEYHHPKEGDVNLIIGSLYGTLILFF